MKHCGQITNKMTDQGWKGWRNKKNNLATTEFEIRPLNLKIAVLPTDLSLLRNEPFKYYVIKDVGGWGQKMAIFDDL